MRTHGVAKAGQSGWPASSVAGTIFEDDCYKRSAGLYGLQISKCFRKMESLGF